MELSKILAELPNFMVLGKFVIVVIFLVVVGCESTQDVMQLMMTNSVLWHNICRNEIDNQKVERARKNMKNQSAQ